MRKRKAFTLIEVLVTTAIAAVLTVAVGTAFYFVVVLNENTLENSSMTYKARTVREYILNIAEDHVFEYDEEDRILYDSTDSKVVISDSSYIAVDFTLDTTSDVAHEILNCTITYKLNDRKTTTETLDFVVKITPTP